jgi:hypothetical protein
MTSQMTGRLDEADGRVGNLDLQSTVVSAADRRDPDHWAAQDRTRL